MIDEFSVVRHRPGKLFIFHESCYNIIVVNGKFDIPVIPSCAVESLEDSFSKGKNAEETGKHSVAPAEWRTMIFFFLAAIATRLYKIQIGDFVVWDEAHFGKFGGYYLLRSFYFDVHPPLGKMLVALAGYISGFNGVGFTFESAKSYIGHVNYISMRIFVALFGTMVVPMGYLTALQLRLTHTTACLVGLMLLFDVGLIGITRLILLDSFLLCFTSSLLLGYSIFRNSKEFTPKWHFGLILTGLSIGCVSSVKWVGFFPTALVGLLTIEELCKMIVAPNFKISKFLRSFAARAIGLIVIPVAVYVASFALHFHILNHSGPGDSNMNSLFQASLHGSDLANNPLYIVYGSNLTLRNYSHGGGLLHSHRDKYPAGSKQQQVTTYHHKDVNNEWVIYPASKLSEEMIEVDYLEEYEVFVDEVSKTKEEINDSPVDEENINAAGAGGEGEEKQDEPVVVDGENASGEEEREKKIMTRMVKKMVPVEFSKKVKVESGDLIKLIHTNTGGALHSHRIKAPLTSEDFEVSTYGVANPKIMDPNDFWEIELVRESTESHIMALKSNFRLKHVSTGCYLSSKNKKLPDWGFKQGEVTCTLNKNDGKALVWNVERHRNGQLQNGDANMYKSSFIEDLKDIHVGMFMTNNALTPDPELEPGILTSNAADWFFMTRGIRMCSWSDDKIKFYMLGNPAVWWTGSLSVICLGLLILFYAVLKQRKANNLLPRDHEDFTFRTKLVLGGWAIIYFPFFVMGRVLYLHHYYPALLFSTYCFGVVFDHLVIRKLSKRHQLMTSVVVGSIVFLSFVYFSPMCYGISGPSKEFLSRRWLKSWNL